VCVINSYQEKHGLVTFEKAITATIADGFANDLSQKSLVVCEKRKPFLEGVRRPEWTLSNELTEVQRWLVRNPHSGFRDLPAGAT
jgi:hypothetical protein